MKEGKYPNDEIVKEILLGTGYFISRSSVKHYKKSNLNNLKSNFEVKGG